MGSWYYPCNLENTLRRKKNSNVVVRSVHVVQQSVPDPDLEVRGEGLGGWGGLGGGGSGRSSRPLDKRGSPVSKKIFFGPSGLSLV